MRRITVSVVVWVLAVAGLVVATPSPVVDASAHTPTTYVVTNTSHDVNVVGSLPWAVHQANFATPGFDRIHFSIPGAGPHTINLTSTLFVVDQVDIDARTQPGWSGAPLVWLHGSVGAPSIFYLTNNPWSPGVTSSGTSIGGFGMFHYPSNAVTIWYGSEGNWIHQNWIGFRPTASGVLLNHATGLPGASTSRGIGIATGWNKIRWNTISGVDNGVTVGSDRSNEPAIVNWFAGNHIGTNPAGTSTAGYGNIGDGIFLGRGASMAWIGPGNVLSGNDSAGVEMFTRDNVGSIVFGNYIGLDVTGKVALGNGELGVLLTGGATGNAIGGPWGGNHIAGNRLGGVSIGTQQWGGGHGNWVHDNVIGMNVDGVPVGHQDVGVTVGSGSRWNSISGNWIGGNRVHGILVGDQTWRGTQNNSVHANSIGLAPNGFHRPNAAFGVYLWNARHGWVVNNTWGPNGLGWLGQQSTSGNVIVP